jgi:hypothetical protein
MTRRRLLIPSFLAACLLLTGCFAIDDFEIQEMLTATEDVAVDLSANPDREVQAAAAASEEIRKDKEARRSMQRALDNNQLDAALEAVELRPFDPRIRLEFGALLLANGQIDEARYEFGFGGEVLRFDGQSDRVRYQYAADALLRVREALDPETESWTRVNEQYCEAVHLYAKTAPQEGANVLDSIFTVASYPDDACPGG